MEVSAVQIILDLRIVKVSLTVPQLDHQQNTSHLRVASSTPSELRLRKKQKKRLNRKTQPHRPTLPPLEAILPRTDSI